MLEREVEKHHGPQAQLEATRVLYALVCRQLTEANARADVAEASCDAALAALEQYKKENPK